MHDNKKYNSGGTFYRDLENLVKIFIKERKEKWI